MRIAFDDLPASPTKLPDKFVVPYSPASRKEDDTVYSLLSRFGIPEGKYYSAHKSRWGTRLLVRQER